MSATGLAVRAGVSIAYVSQLEAGKRAPSLAALLALAGALRCEPWELLVLDADDPRATLLDAIRDHDWSGADAALVVLGRPAR